MEWGISTTLTDHHHRAKLAKRGEYGGIKYHKVDSASPIY